MVDIVAIQLAPDNTYPMGDGELPCSTNFCRGLTRMDRSAYDLIAMAPGQFLGEHHIPLAG